MSEILRGLGDRIGLSTVLQLAEMECLSGRVSLTSGEVGLHVGTIVRARCGSLTGVEGLLELLLRPPGGFTLEVTDQAAAPPLGNLASLILEGCRLQDEWRRVEARVFVPARPDALSGPLAALRPVLDGRRRIAEAVTLARLACCRVADPLVQAVEAGDLLERPAPPVPAGSNGSGPPGGTSVDFDTAIAEGRRCVREGRLDVARAAFERALGERPDDRIALQNLRRLAAIQGA
ncbi:MAG: hypothetical protein Q8P41_28880 [Pseudomonadota bacterium]|nr:hypothetical protein [Pseudomonadota bacterium]